MLWNTFWQTFWSKFTATKDKITITKYQIRPTECPMSCDLTNGTSTTANITSTTKDDLCMLPSEEKWAFPWIRSHWAFNFLYAIGLWHSVPFRAPRVLEHALATKPLCLMKFAKTEAITGKIHAKNLGSFLYLNNPLKHQQGMHLEMPPACELWSLPLGRQQMHYVLQAPRELHQWQGVTNNTGWRHWPNGSIRY